MEDSLYYRVTVSPDSSFSYDLSGDVASVVWEQRVNTPAMLTITVPDPFKVMSHALREGMYVEYELGTDSDHPLVFQGIIYTVESSFPSAGIPVLTLKAYDGLKELGMHKHSATRTEACPLKQIVEDIVTDQRYRFAEAVFDLSGEFNIQEAQLSQTDLDYLATLCTEHECMMFVHPKPGTSGQFVFTDAATLMKHSAEVTLSYGRLGVENPMIEFQATVDAESLHVPLAVTVLEWANAKPIDAIKRAPESPLEAEDPFLDENLAAIDDIDKRARLSILIQAVPAAAETVKQMRLAGAEAEAAEPNGVFSSKEEMEHKANNWTSIHAHGMTGSGRTGGTPRLRAHSPVQIDDVGGRFSGKWFLTEVRHILGRDGYHTEFSCRR